MAAPATSLGLFLWLLLATDSSLAFTISSSSSFVGRQYDAAVTTLSAVNVDKDTTSSAPPTTTMAQTFAKGPWTVNGSGKPLTKQELDQVKADLAQLKQEFGYREPTRSFMDAPDTQWRYGGPPDYALANYLYLTQRTQQHAPGSLEEVVENLVKTWEMERSHKVDPTQHQSVDQDKFRISANGGHVFDNVSANQVGNYNVLLNSCPANLYDAQSLSWEESHDKFETAFAAFPWEVLQVFSGPPKVAFSWRHWATFTGTYEGNAGKGELVEMFGFGTAVVNDKLQLQDVEIFYDPTSFLNVLKGNKTPAEVNQLWNAGACPFHAVQAAAAQRRTSWLAKVKSILPFGRNNNNSVKVTAVVN
ncbi:hypothetical protein ACA910_007579 [Epithemia clementina (nom. ined.)]